MNNSKIDFLHIPGYCRIAVSAALFILLVGDSIAQVVVPFSVRYQTTAKGGISFVSNSILTCDGSDVDCAPARAEVAPSGTSQDNQFNMQYIDVDGIGSTFSSSSADLGIPTCSYVTFAGLYWGGSIHAGTSNYANRNSLKFKSPGAGSYTTLTADTMVNNTTGFVTYHCFKNVTTMVRAAGNGTYTMADIVARHGSSNQFSGWSLVVCYQNDSMSQRQLTVFDGLFNVSNTDKVDVSITGFRTPVVGPVNFEIGLNGYDGDRGFTGDSLYFNDGVGTLVPVSNGTNPVHNIYNSTITYNNANILTRNPSYGNTLGYDADIFIPNNAAKNYLTNNQTSALLRITSGGETFLTQVITTAIDVYEPDFRMVKTATDINGGTAMPGDTILYSIQAMNLGNDTSLYSTVTDTIPFNTDYVQGSLIVTGGPNAGVKTDMSNDDEAEYNSTSNLVKFRLGVGANSSLGGSISNIAPNNETTFEFKVIATSDCAKLLCNNIISNQCTGAIRGSVSGVDYISYSQPNGTDSLGCPMYGPTQTTLVIPPTCSLPGDTAVDACVLPYYLSNLGSMYAGYVFQNSSFVNVSIATVTGTYYGIYYTGGNCNDTIEIDFTTSAPDITSLGLTYPTCINAPNGGVIQVNGINGTDSMAYVIGTIFTSAPFTLASSLPTANTFITLAGDTYTVRVKRPPLDCYYDTTVVLNYINCQPYAADDTYGVMGNTDVNSDVGSNDDEPDADPATYAVLDAPLNGTLVFNPDGTFIFSPGSFRGTATFTYTICDNRVPSLCDTGLVTINVISPLPVEMGAFTGDIKNNGVLLSWNTLSEKNNNYFEVQRAGDGEHFNVIAKITGQGTTNDIHHYKFFDDKPFKGWNYYRLKQVDFDGKTTMSATVKENLDNHMDDKIIIYPNPNNGAFRLKVNCEEEGRNKITITSQYGNVIHESSIYCTGQSIVTEIQLKDIPKGMYYLLVNNSDKTSKYKFTVK